MIAPPGPAHEGVIHRFCTVCGWEQSAAIRENTALNRGALEAVVPEGKDRLCSGEPFTVTWTDKAAVSENCCDAVELYMSRVNAGAATDGGGWVHLDGHPISSIILRTKCFTRSRRWTRKIPLRRRNSIP